MFGVDVSEHGHGVALDLWHPMRPGLDRRPFAAAEARAIAAELVRGAELVEAEEANPRHRPRHTTAPPLEAGAGVLHSQHRDRASVADAHLVPGNCPRAATARGTFQKGRSCLSGSSNGWPWAESAGSGRAGDLTGGSRGNVNGDDPRGQVVRRVSHDVVAVRCNRGHGKADKGIVYRLFCAGADQVSGNGLGPGQSSAAAGW